MIKIYHFIWSTYHILKVTSSNINPVTGPFMHGNCDTDFFSVTVPDGQGNENFGLV